MRATWVAFHVQCYSPTPTGVVRSSLRRAAAGEGAEAQPGEVPGACRRGRRRWGARSSVRRRGDVFLGACRRRRRRGALKLCQLRAAWGATGQLSGIWLGLLESASGDAAHSLYVHMAQTHKPTYVQYRGLYTALLWQQQCQVECGAAYLLFASFAYAYSN